MSSNPTTPGPIPVSPHEDLKKPPIKKQSKRKAKAKPELAKPNKTLPNWRVGVSKQFDIVRAYAAGSNKGTKAVTLEEASQIAGMAPTTVVAAIPFLTSIALLKRTDTGGFLPSAEAVSYLSAYDWDQTTAAHKIGPKLRDAWFGEALLPRISYGQAVEEKLAVNILAEACGACPDYERELRMLIEFLAIGGVVQREGGQVKQVKPSGSGEAEPSQRPEEHKPSEVDPAPKGTRVNSTYTAQSTPTPGGGFDFSVSVHVNMAEFGGWKPERINAFFRGIAEVLAAKADIERGGAGS
jgi:hypothetical protein